MAAAMADQSGLRSGAALSLMLHGGVALIAALGLPSLWSKPPAAPGVISVDLVMESLDSLAVYEPEEVTTETPQAVQVEDFKEDAALADDQADPLESRELAAEEPEAVAPTELLESQDLAAVEPEITRQEKLEATRPAETVKAQDFPQTQPDPALENAVTLAQRIPDQIVESREVDAEKPVALAPDAAEVSPQPAEAKIVQSIEALVAREVEPQAEVSVADSAPVRIEEVKSKVIEAAEIEPEIETALATVQAPVKPQVPVQAADADLVPPPPAPLPRKKPRRIAALAPKVETTPKKKKTRDIPVRKKKKARSFADVASAVGRAQPRKRSGSGTVPRLSNAEWDPLRAAIKKCWRLDRGAKEQAEVVVQVRLTRGGRLQGRPKWLDPRSTNSARIAFDRAVQALQKCQPFYGLPLKKYAGWQEIELVFRPDGVGFQ